jgi:hypothetical protein
MPRKCSPSEFGLPDSSVLPFVQLMCSKSLVTIGKLLETKRGGVAQVVRATVS